MSIERIFLTYARKTTETTYWSGYAFETLLYCQAYLVNNDLTILYILRKIFISYGSLLHKRLEKMTHRIGILFNLRQWQARGLSLN